MPGRPFRPCNYPGCRTLTDNGTSRCEKHPRQAWAHAGSESRHARGYGSEWDRLRLKVLERDGYRCRCAECTASGALTVAHEVDHVVPKARGGTDDMGNLQAINRECHRRKTKREGVPRGGV